MPDVKEIERELQILEVELRKLEGEYNMYFAGRLPRPPWETRSRVEGLVKKLDRSYIQNYGDRFRFSTLQSRFAAFIDLWDRGLRAREEGRPGPFSRKPAATARTPAKAEDKILFVASFRDPMKEMDKLHDLYDTLRDAREQLGEQNIPFHKFTELVKSQVSKLKKEGAPEVAFRVSVKDGKLNFTARGLKGAK
ncbi:MAG TPA: MXAN_5187 C-terminal domain-containing protein [Vicinamibacterales bacterium]|nr:MXAN_5187 C-terminal domain-containing protein [Vicinamibacterales bacterium]